MCGRKRQMAITNPVLFLAADRELAEEAWAGDIIGIPNPRPIAHSVIR